MNQANLANKALQDLAHLNSDEIASRFRAAGITGRQVDVLHDPVAQYLCGRGVAVLAVTEREVDLMDGAVVALPGSVGYFIHLFDRGNYPDLVSEPAEGSGS